MDGLNRVTLLGNLGQDAELKGSGNSVLVFSLATSESWTDGTGQKKSETEWHQVVIFGKRAEALAKLDLTKGTRLLVEGKIHRRSYQDREGQTRYAFEVIGHNVVLCGGGRGGGGQRPGAQEEPGGAGGGDDDDIPY